jgi:transposase-like protein
MERRNFSAEFKLQVVMESFQRDTTIEAVCRKFTVGRTQVNSWRAEFKKGGANIFLDKRNPKRKAISQGFNPGESPDDLKKIIGNLTVQNEILKKVQGLLS